MTKISSRRAVAEVNLAAIGSNVRRIKAVLSPNTALMAVVKADGYGHGLIPVAEAAVSNGADCLGVAIIEEALELRENGITVPILILGHTAEDLMKTAVKNNIMLTVFNLKTAVKLSEICAGKGLTADIHIKLDTGMSRIGFLPTDKSFGEMAKISGLPSLRLAGVYTHLASSDDEDKSFCYRQKEIFLEMLKKLESLGVTFPVRHISNSGAILGLRDFDFEMVRAGILIYGLSPADSEAFDKLELEPALVWKSYISCVKRLSENESVSYGRTVFTKRESVIATVPTGYGDGYSRALSNKGMVVVNDKTAPIIGRVCMDQFMIDVTDIEDVHEGDEVLLIGKQGIAEVTANDLAEIQGTINYEVVCNISKRVRRAYV